MTNEKLQIPRIQGEEVTLSDGSIVWVYPIGVRHIMMFTKDIATVLSMAMRVFNGAKKDEDGTKGFELIMTTMPYMISNVIQIVTTCVRFDKEGKKLEELPHYDLPDIIDAWWELSFAGEGKLSPWRRMVEKFLSRALNKQTSISEILSKFSSRADTTGETSSTSPNQGSLIQDGASNNSSSG